MKTPNTSVTPTQTADKDLGTCGSNANVERVARGDRPRFTISKQDMKPNPDHYCNAILENGLEVLVRFKRENGRTFLFLTNGWHQLRGNGYGLLFAGSTGFRRVFLP